jgi:predicted RecB family nuclease
LPIRFIPDEKLTTADKLLLAFDAFALTLTFGKAPYKGKIIHGSQYSNTAVPLTKLLDPVRSLVKRIATQQSEATPPPLVLNKHCAECEFQSRCRKLALEKDELSLLANLTTKDRKQQHEKGIFTVTQLSYTFRPRKRAGSLQLKRQHALRALAIRKNQIHVLGTPAIAAPGTPVYFDVEGVPDRDFYYLVGLRYESGGGSYVQHSFWANEPSEERAMWADCIRTLAAIGNPRLIHYGSYETQFLKRMQARYTDVSNNPAFVDQLLGSALNLVSIIYAHVYFPTYSNSLKEVAEYLGFSWSQPNASGLVALVWRAEWESSFSPDLKQQLLTYNAEDCQAAQRVADVLAHVCSEQGGGLTPNAEFVNVDVLRREYPQRFGKIDLVLPEFQQINAAAYWDYQRSKVYVRSNNRLKVVSRKIRSRPAKALAINKEIDIEDRRPECCPRCTAKLIYKYGRLSSTVYDIHFGIASMKRWVVRYCFHRFICWHCRNAFQRQRSRPKYGFNLQAYLLYQIIELRMSQRAAAQNLHELFGFDISKGSVNQIKAHAAEYYGTAYQSILNKITRGQLVHADETMISIGGADGYVWVFTSFEEVAYVYSETREATIAHELLSDFHGVLVSDFYAAYDSIKCDQQKCLVHLMRDVNDDIRKEPFNEEMKEVGRDFGALLQLIVATVDRFGLKACHLRKHKPAVERFYEALAKRDYRTEVAVSCKKRFEKHRGKLFTFLDHDGVPWNNNNAEHAIKAFVMLRNVIGGTSSAKGIREYLTLLSICETCKYKGASFLNFLRSREIDVAAFAARVDS